MTSIGPRVRRRILVVTSSYPTPERSRASVFVEDWAAELVNIGHRVHVLAPAMRGQAHGIRRARAVSVESLPYAWPASRQTLAFGDGMFDNVMRHPLRLLQAVPLLGAMVAAIRERARGADVVHAHWLIPGGLAAALALRVGAPPLIVTVHSTDFHLLRRLPAGRLLARFIVARAARMHFVANYLEREFTQWLAGGAVASYTAPMGYGRQFVSTPLRASEPRVGFIGRLVPIKGADLLVEACGLAGLKALCVAGGGPERHRLQELAQLTGTELQFRGRLDGEELPDFFSSCDVFVFPSREYPSGRTEGTPVALLEALRCGRIVIASDVGGIRDVISHGVNGYLVPPGDIGALAHRIRAVVDSWPSVRSIGPAAATSVESLSAANLSARHWRSYEEVLAARVGSPLPPLTWMAARESRTPDL